jgi:SpoVK/Ycf46/Vps4 family AAA+-type ATPase
VVVKLGQIKSDQQLMEVLHGETIRVKNDEIKLPISERIYVFEDVDAETDIVFKRSSSSSSSSSSCSPLSYSDPVHMNDKDMKSITTSIIKTEQLTLAGLLNALDGFLELYGAIVIVTTNHRNKLDPAFVRPGRIDMEIEFKTMQSVDAEHMIRRHFQLHETARMPFSIPNNAITPCLLESVLHQSSSLNDIEIILQKHNVLKAQESKGDEKKEDDNKHEEKEEKQRVVTPSKRKRKR